MHDIHKAYRESRNEENERAIATSIFLVLNGVIKATCVKYIINAEMDTQYPTLSM
jgi:hypothetical protein